MSEDYLKIEVKQLGYFVGAIVAAAVVVTAIYWAVFGMNKWTANVQLGTNLMLAAAPGPYQGQPLAGKGTAGQYVCPRDGAVGLPVLDAAGAPHCPACNQVMSFNGAPVGVGAGSAGLAAFGGG